MAYINCSSAIKSVRRASQSSEAIFLGIVALSYGLVFPIGEYAILDDWAYVKSLQHLQNHGRLVILDWNPMPLLGHLFWGLAFTIPCGLSFTATKLAVVVAAALQGIVVLRLLAQFKMPKTLTLAIVCAVFFNPLYFPHCFMFMTDVPAITFQWCALLLLLQGIDHRENRTAIIYLVVGSLLIGLSYTTRQHGAVMLGAVIIEWILFRRAEMSSLRLLASSIPAALVFVAFSMWYRYVHGWTPAFITSLAAVEAFIASPPWQYFPYIGMTFLVYLGLFAAPLSLPFLATSTRLPGMWRNFGFVVSALVLGNLFIAAALEQHSFPFMQNVVTQWGFFRPNEFVLGDRPILWGSFWALACGLLGVSSTLSLTAMFLSEREWFLNDPKMRLQRILVILLILQLGYLFLTAPILYDRHLIILLPTVCVLTGLNVKSFGRGGSLMTIVIVFAFATYSIACTHDVHSISRAIFNAGEELIQNGVHPDKIDAGYAFDGWHMYEQSQPKEPAEAIKIPPWWPQPIEASNQRFIAPWWVEHLIPAIQPHYVVSLSSMPPNSEFGGKYQFELFSSNDSYLTYWPWRRCRVHVFKRLK